MNTKTISEAPRSESKPEPKPLPEACVALIAGRGTLAGRFLAVTRPDGRLSLPGGKVEPGESRREALVREVSEEAGIVLVATTELFTRNVPGRTSYATTCFRVGAFGWEGECVAREPGMSVAWVSPEDLLSERAAFVEFNRDALALTAKAQDEVDT